jgi:alpha/beta superfamily hydrolase/regulator of RNase E activity RraB
MSRTSFSSILAFTSLCIGIGFAAPLHAQSAETDFAKARAGFETKLKRPRTNAAPLLSPPEELFEEVQVQGPLGTLDAYLGKPPSAEEGKKFPAILWVTGGFPPGGVDETAWEPAKPDFDQSAKVYREAGFVMMYPTVRGSFGNDGKQEVLLGEVDDILAAAEHLKAVPYVDANRIYLGGHSTGGSLALLVAAAAKPKTFAAVIAFGAIDEVTRYPKNELTFDTEDEKEVRLRSPMHWLSGITCPTFVIEGVKGNIEALRALSKQNAPNVKCIEVVGANHYNVLAAVNSMLARKLAALGSGTKLELTQAEVQTSFDGYRGAIRESRDLAAISRLRQRGQDLGTECIAEHKLFHAERTTLEGLAKGLATASFEADEITEDTDEEGKPLYYITLRAKVIPRDLDAVFAMSKKVADAADKCGASYLSWEAKNE